jgi:hypothetical protein
VREDLLATLEHRNLTFVVRNVYFRQKRRNVDLHLMLPPLDVPDPLTITCYYCQAQPRQGCRTAGGAVRTPHALRRADAELAARGHPVSPPYRADVIDIKGYWATRRRAAPHDNAARKAVVLDFVAAWKHSVARKNGFRF